MIIDTLLNHYLRLDPDLMPALAPFRGKTMKVSLTDLGFSFYLTIEAADISLHLKCDDEPAAILSGSSLSLLQLGITASSVDARTLFNDDVSISGDIEFAEGLKHSLDNRHIDWEEHLSSLTGDMIAHQLFNEAHKAKQWLLMLNDNCKDNISEYLQEESRLLPPRAEFASWSEQIDLLQMDVDRLNAQLDRILKDVTCSRDL